MRSQQRRTDAARASAAKAEKAAADARWSALSAAGSATRAKQSADAARESAVNAQESAAEAQQAYDDTFKIAMDKYREEEKARRAKADADAKHCERPPGYGADASCTPCAPGQGGDVICWQLVVEDGATSCATAQVTDEERLKFEREWQA